MEGRLSHSSVMNPVIYPMEKNRLVLAEKRQAAYIPVKSE